MHQFFVSPENVGEDSIRLTGTDVNHICNVLRMKPGDEMMVADGQGRNYLCALAQIEEQEILLEIKGEEAQGTEPTCEFYLFQGLPKADKMEWIVQKAVELGVREVIPVATKRAVVRLDEKKAKKKQERWQAIAESAAKQSRRGIIPDVTHVMSYKEALEYAKTMDISMIPYENFKDMKETRAVLDIIKPGQKVGIFIGPEGGFEEEEVALAMKQEIHPVSLGRRILRTETAGMALLSVLMFQLEE